MNTANQSNIKLGDYLDIIIGEHREENATFFKSKEWCLDDKIMEKILKITPNDKLLIEIVGYGDRVYPLREHIEDLKIKNLALEGVQGFDFSFYIHIKSNLEYIMNKIGLRDYENIMRLEIKLIKTGFNKRMVVSLVPVISKEVDKKELERVLKGIRRVEEDIWGKESEPAGRELFISSVDIYSVENGEKKKIVSYNMEGELCVYEHESKSRKDKW